MTSSERVAEAIWWEDVAQRRSPIWIETNWPGYKLMCRPGSCDVEIYYHRARAAIAAMPCQITS